MGKLDEMRDAVLGLPQKKADWIVVVRRLRAWVEEEGEPIQPWLVLCTTRSQGMVLGMDLLPALPSPEEVLGVLYDCMLEPTPSAGWVASRPMKIVFDDMKLSRALREELDAIGVRASFSTPPPEIDLIVADLNEQLFSDDEAELQGLLEVEGVTPKIAGALFAAAADFYRAEPWIQLSNAQTLAVSFPSEDQTWYVTVMGQGGVEYGLILQPTWAEVERLFRKLDDPIGGIPSEGWHSISFEPAHQMPFSDLEAVETYGWDVADEDAYPMPVIFDSERAHRPPAQELALWERVMRAVIEFSKGYLESDGAGDYKPVEAALKIPFRSQEVAAQVCYPAGQRDRGEQAYRTVSPATTMEDGMPVPDRRALEGVLMNLSGGYEDSDLMEAQRIMYEAWDSHDREERIRLAELALARSPHCADAYVLFAEEKARTVREALEFFRKGVAAGETALGPDTFQQDAGHFWGILETRPYMRARYGMANCLWELNRTEEAEAHYRDLLNLNPGDNQGVRYTLLRLLMDTERYQEALEHIEEHGDDSSAEILYNRALLLFRLHGQGEGAEEALLEALEWNPHVVPYVLGAKRVPHDLPMGVGFGDESEAIFYADDYLNYWRRAPGALDWLRSHS